MQSPSQHASLMSCRCSQINSCCLLLVVDRDVQKFAQPAQLMEVDVVLAETTATTKAHLEALILRLKIA
jgi:hypothetical protein